MIILELNHVAIHVTDVKRSSSFYHDVLRLEAIPRPAFDFPGPGSGWARARNYTSSAGAARWRPPVLTIISL